MTGILLDSNYEPIISSGEMVLGEITAQNQAIILRCHKGEIKEHPALGVGISDMLLDHNPLYWRSRIREALELDGQSLEEIKISAHTISLSGGYT